MTFVNFSYKLFFERSFNPIAIYSTESPPSELTIGDIIFADINLAYERVNKVSREEVIGRSFYDVWPGVEPYWGDTIIKCIKTEKPAQCEGTSASTGTYLKVIAFPFSEDSRMTVATITLDMTDWKKANDKLKQNHKKLLRYQDMLRELATQVTISGEQTRREIGRAMHDSIGHTLLTLLLDLRKIYDEHTNELSAETVAVIGAAVAKTEKMIEESRRLIFELSPTILLEIGLEPAIEGIADMLLTPRKILWEVTSKGKAEDFPVDDAICVLLYRMTKELIINVIKHADASKVNISINRGPHKIQVVVEDNGRGIPKNSIKKDGFCHLSLGLFSIRERLLHLGGKLQIISGSEGTSVSMLVPLNKIYSKPHRQR